MSEIKQNLYLYLKLYYKNTIIDRKFVDKKKKVLVGNSKKIFWQILDPQFPHKHLLFTKIKGKNCFKLNLPEFATLENFCKGENKYNDSELEALSKEQQFEIDHTCSGTIILTDDYKISFEFQKKADEKVEIPDDLKNVQKRRFTKDDKRILKVLAGVLIFWILLIVLTESITLPTIKRAFKAAGRFAEVTITTPKEIPAELEPEGEKVDEKEKTEPKPGEKLTQEERVERETQKISARLFTTIGGIGETGKTTDDLVSTGSTVSSKSDGDDFDVSTELEKGLVTSRKEFDTNINKFDILSDEESLTKGELVDAALAEKLKRTGTIKQSEISDIKGISKLETINLKSEFQKIVENYVDGLIFVHSEMLKKYPNLFGKMYIKFVITPEGNLKSVSIQSSTIQNEEFENRILQKISNWNFPPIQTGTEEIQFIYPLIFTQ